MASCEQTPAAQAAVMQTAEEQVTAAHDMVKQETVEQETMQQETVEQETARQETVEQETVEQETVEQETVEQQTVEQQTVEQQTVEQERAQQETAQQEADQQEPDEETPLLAKAAEPAPQAALVNGVESQRMHQLVCGAFLGLVMVVLSATLISANKYLMSKGRFPYAVVMILSHAICCSACAGLLLLVRPSFFPSLTDPMRKIDWDVATVLKKTSPVAVFFIFQLVLGNMAYSHASVAFLQMIKESNVATVYIISLLVGLEASSARNALVISLIVFATALTVRGELHFSFTGLVLQVVSCLFESFRTVLQGVLLCGGGSGKKLDGLTYVLLVMPQVMVCLGLVVLAEASVVDISFVHLPTWAELMHFRWILLGNAMLAFALNVSIALFIQHSSPLAFLLAGITKDASIVLGSAAIFSEPLGALQTGAFSLQLALVTLWSLMKSFPEAFAQGGQLAFIFPPALRAPQKGEEI